MRVNATQFQQNVGHYFKLAEEGEKIIIEKKKPNTVSFILLKEKSKTPITKKTKTLFDTVQPLIHTGVKESGIDLQKRVRQ